MPKIIDNVREQLLAVAKRQVTERGYAKTTIRSVAGECGLAVGTVYNYFSSKDMLIASFMVVDWLDCIRRAAESPSTDAEQRLRAIYDALLRFSDKYNALFADSDAHKAFSGVFSDRHKQLRSQLAELILPVCESCGSDDSAFLSEFIAEALLSWTMAGVDFDTVSKPLMKLIKK